MRLNLNFILLLIAVFHEFQSQWCRCGMSRGWMTNQPARPILFSRIAFVLLLILHCTHPAPASIDGPQSGNYFGSMLAIVIE